MHLGLNLYLWGQVHQDRLLIECIGPAVRELLRNGTCTTFWFDRFDARGPHLLLVLGIHGDGWTAATSLLSSRLDTYLVLRPSTEQLHLDELASRHEACRGKLLCDVDAETGFAANNTYRLFQHKAEFYPFSLAGDLTAADELWSRWCDVSLWALECIADGETQPAAARWVATIARVLDTMPGGSEPYWRHHTQRLIPGFEEWLRTAGARVVAAELRTTMDSVGGDVLLAEFGGQAVPHGTIPNVDRLVHVVANGDDHVAERRWPLLYALTHTTLKQLGLRVPRHVPLILTAWLLSYGPGE
jgi:hypothetical protein